MNCYAEKMASRYGGIDKNGKPLPYHGLVDDKGRWNGVIRSIPSHLWEPRKWKDGRKIFVNSMSDLFHENLPQEEIELIFAVMALFERHTFQFLTKREKRMQDLLSSPKFWENVMALCEVYAERVEGQSQGAMMGFDAWAHEVMDRKALRHVWVGVSAENQECLEKRWACLRETPAGIRWISAEPLLGPLVFSKPETGEWPTHGKMLRNPEEWDDWKYWGPAAVDWIVVGGESKQSMDARPCEIEWIRGIKDQCHVAKTPLWVKQLGGMVLTNGCSSGRNDVDGLMEHFPGRMCSDKSPEYRSMCEHRKEDGSFAWHLHLKDSHGADMKEWPEDLRVQKLPKVPVVIG